MTEPTADDAGKREPPAESFDETAGDWLPAEGRPQVGPAIEVNPGQPVPDEAATESPAGDDDSLLRFLFYGLSLPERTVRSVSAVAGGLLSETASRLIPTAFRSSRSYSLFIQQSLDMAVHDVGGVGAAGSQRAAEADAARQAAQQEADFDQNMLARKAVGGMLDIASMSTLHLSPLTVLAALSDVAYGSSYFLRQLGDELKRQGVIDQASSIDHVSDLLDALQDAGGQASETLDQPPINLQGLRDTIDQTRQAVGKIDPVRLIPQAEIERMWGEMEAAAEEANVSLLDVGGTMTMFAMNRLTLATRGALSTVSVAGNLIDQHVLSHYGDAITEIRREGLYTTLSTVSTPYLEAVWRNFDNDTVTWTEDFLSGRLLTRTFDSVRSWWAK